MTGLAQRAAQRRNRCVVCGALPDGRCNVREHERRNAWPLTYWAPDPKAPREQNHSDDFADDD